MDQFEYGKLYAVKRTDHDDYYFRSDNDSQNLNYSHLFRSLNELGARGWQLVGMYKESYIMMRKVVG